MSKRIFPAILAIILATFACNLPQATPVPTQVIVVTATPLPATAIQPTSPSTNTPIPTIGIPSPTTTSQPCNLASFVSDVSYPDNSQVAPSFPFTKTWRLRNVGSCTWTAGYQIVFDSGDPMGNSTPKPLIAGTVLPGQTVDVSVDLVAPATTGTYRANFRIREPGGVLFALQSGPFWVQIKVVGQPPVLPDWPIVSQGDTGAEVFAIQYLLRYYGQNIDADGIFGPSTRTAVIAYQTANGLTADGTVGPNTWSKLTAVQLAQGASNEAVRAAQYLLRNKFGSGIAVDGIFGPQTRTAVSTFQDNNNLSATGIVDGDTWQALVGY